MKRKLSSFMSAKTLKHITCIPKSIKLLNNWLPFILNYIGLIDDNNIQIYKFRNGTKLITNESSDTATIAVVYIKKEYGNTNDNSIVVDIGSHIGVFSIYATKTARNIKVYSYEPMRDNFKILQKNIKLNNCETTIFPFELAVGQKKEKRRLYVNSGSQFHSSFSSNENQDSIEIECICLSDIFQQNNLSRIDVLKMDCQGAEYEILYNTPDKYLERIHKLYMECHKGPEKMYNINAIDEYLTRKGFSTKIFPNSLLWAIRPK